MKHTITIEKTIDLKQCPFCGGDADPSEDNSIEFIIECSLCGVSMYVCKNTNPNYLDICVERWNKRILGGGS